MGITIEKVEAIAAKLRAMPPVENKKREVSKQESIKLLTAEIAAMRERGYTLEQIAALLTDDLQIGTHARLLATCRVRRQERQQAALDEAQKAASTATSPSSTSAPAATSAPRKVSRPC